MRANAAPLDILKMMKEAGCVQVEYGFGVNYHYRRQNFNRVRYERQFTASGKNNSYRPNKDLLLCDSVSAQGS